MTIEEQLKEIIINRYKSIRAFTQEVDIPYSTVDTMLKRGIGGTGVSTVMKIFLALGLDIESISKGVLTPVTESSSYHTADSVASRIKAIMRYRNMSYSQLADKLSMEESVLRDYIEKTPEDSFSSEDKSLQRIADTLKVDIGVFFKYDSFSGNSFDNYIGFLADKVESGLPMTEFESDFYRMYLGDEVSSDTFDILNRYISVDEHGRRIVDMVLDEEYRRCNPADISEPDDIEDTAEEDDDDIEYRAIPYSLLPASAGPGEWFENNNFDEINIPDTPKYRLVDFAVRVIGDSMEPDYEEGDIVLVHEQKFVRPGEIGIFWVYGKGGLIKEMGDECLISHNKKYADISVKHRRFQCFGRVIGKWEEDEE